MQNLRPGEAVNLALAAFGFIACGGVGVSLFYTSWRSRETVVSAVIAAVCLAVLTIREWRRLTRIARAGK